MNRHFTYLQVIGKRAAAVMLSLILVVVAKAQNDGQVSMYWDVPTLFNPATAGSDSAMIVRGFQRMQWVGMDDAPTTTFLSVDMPFKFLKKRHGAGITLNNDKAGLFSTTIISGEYSYSKTLFKGRFAAGLSVGMVNQSFDGTKVHLPDGEEWDAADEYMPRTDVAGRSLDLGLGVFYERKFGENQVYGGLSAMHLNEATIDLDEYAYSQQKRTYYFLAGGNIPLTSTLFILQPSLLVKTTTQATQTDFTLRANYNNRYWGGVSYRTGDAVVVMIGAEFQSIRLEYAYDICTSALAKATSGSHEILASYRMKLDLDKNKKHPHKSIRIL